MIMDINDIITDINYIIIDINDMISDINYINDIKILTILLLI